MSTVIDSADFQVFTPQEIMGRPPMEWAVHRILPRTGLVSIYGASGTGKSFLAVDLMGNMVNGCTWFGHEITSDLRVSLVSLEGQSGNAKRLKAWQEINRRDFPDRHRLVEGQLQIGDLNNVALLAKKLTAHEPVDVVMIDTLNRAAFGADENRSSDMGKIIRGATELARLTGALIILIHHCGKDVERGLRGHSSLHAALDVVVEVRESGGNRSWVVTKAKDEIEGVAHSFVLQQVEVGADEFGRPITSVAIVPSSAPPVERELKGPRLGKHQEAGVKLLRSMIERKRSGTPESTEPVGIPCREFMEQFASEIDVDQDRKMERAKEALRSLLKGKHFQEQDGQLFPPGE